MASAPSAEQTWLPMERPRLGRKEPGAPFAPRRARVRGSPPAHCVSVRRVAQAQIGRAVLQRGCPTLPGKTAGKDGVSPSHNRTVNYCGGTISRCVGFSRESAGTA